MLYTSLNFRIYETDFDPDSYRLESTLPLFRNNSPVPLFLFGVRTTQQSQTQIQCCQLVYIYQIWKSWYIFKVLGI